MLAQGLSHSPKLRCGHVSGGRLRLVVPGLRNEGDLFDRKQNQVALCRFTENEAIQEPTEALLRLILQF
jgi:hypothetical protein